MVCCRLKNGIGATGKSVAIALVGTGVMCILSSLGMASMVCMHLLKAMDSPGGEELRNGPIPLIPLVCLGVSGVAALIGVLACAVASFLACASNKPETEPIANPEPTA